MDEPVNLYLILAPAVGAWSMIIILIVVAMCAWPTRRAALRK